MRSERKGTEEDQLRRDDKCLISSLLTPLNSLSPSVPLLHKTVSFGFVNRFSQRLGGGGGGGLSKKNKTSLSREHIYWSSYLKKKVLLSSSKALRNKCMIPPYLNDPKQRQWEQCADVFICADSFLQPFELLRDFNHPRCRWCPAR